MSRFFDILGQWRPAQADPTSSDPAVVDPDYGRKLLGTVHMGHPLVETYMRLSQAHPARVRALKEVRAELRERYLAQGDPFDGGHIYDISLIILEMELEDAQPWVDKIDARLGVTLDPPDATYRPTYPDPDQED